MNDFNNVSNVEYILNDTSVDLLYDVLNIDNSFVRTFRIPIDFDGLTVKLINMHKKVRKYTLRSQIWHKIAKNLCVLYTNLALVQYRCDY